MKKPVVYITSIVLISIVLSACNKKVESTNLQKIPKNIVIENPEANNRIEWDDLIEDMTVIPLETTDDNLISTISKVLLTEQFIYILDRNQHVIFIFLKDGKFFNKIVEGPAPDNSRSMNDFTFDNSGNLWILSFQSLEKFAQQGNRISITPVNMEDSEIKYMNPFLVEFSQNSFYLWGGSVGHRGDELQNNPTYAMVQVSQKQDEFSIDRKYFPVKRTLVETTRFTHFQDTVFLTTFQDSDMIYSAYKGDVQPEYHINFGDKAYSNYPGMRDYHKGESELRNDIINNTKLCGGMMTPVLTSSHIAFEYEGNGWGPFHKVIVDRKTLHARSGRITDDKSLSFQIASEYNNSFVAFSESITVSNFVKAQTDTTLLPLSVRKNWATLSKISEADNPAILVVTMKPF